MAPCGCLKWKLVRVVRRVRDNVTVFFSFFDFREENITHRRDTRVFLSFFIFS